jgi:hypothetical protein
MRERARRRTLRVKRAGREISIIVRTRPLILNQSMRHCLAVTKLRPARDVRLR